MRRLLVLLLLLDASLFGCDLLQKKGEDAGVDAAVVAVAPPAVDAAAAAPVPGPTPAAPLGGPTATTTIVRPTVPLDGGTRDAGGPRPDGGPAPAPTPTLNLPNLFDAGVFRIDAGGFKPPWQH